MSRRPIGQRLRRAWDELLGAGAASPVFKGAAGGRLLGDWSPTLLNQNDEVRWSLPRLRARARELSRNNSYARQYLNLLAVNVVGPDGIRYQAQVRDNSGKLNTTINDRIEEAWREWSERASLDGRWSRVELEHQAIETTARDGEGLLRMWYGPDLNRFGFALEPIDPDSLDERLNQQAGSGQNEIRMGVEVDARSRPVAYHLRERTGTSLGIDRTRPPERVPAEQIIHLGRATRPNQTRFATWFAPVMLPMHMLGGYTEAELVAARTAAAKMGFFTRKDENSPPPPAGDEKNNEIIMNADPGTFEFAPDGYDLADWSPEHPSTAFPTFVKAMLREISTGLGVSYNSLANDLENVNYSSMRSGLLIERDMWRLLQGWWVSSLMRRVFREWLNAALLSGALKLDSRDPRKFLAGKWTPRGWQWVDPLKDVQAAVVAIQTGLGSRTEYLAEQGEDPEEVMKELAAELALADELGVDVSGPKGAAAAPANDGEDTKDDGKKAGDGGGGDGGSSSDSARAGGARPDVLAALANGGSRMNGAGPVHIAAGRPLHTRRSR
jgi:lambda family phage portal protein